MPTPITPLRSDLRLPQDLVDELLSGIQPLLGRVVHVELAPGLRQHLVREVRDRHPEVGVAEVDADGEAGGRVEGEEHGGPPAGLPVRHARGLGLLGEQPGLDQVGDDARHRRAGKPGEPGDLRPAGGATTTERVDDAAAIELTQ